MEAVREGVGGGARRMTALRKRLVHNLRGGIFMSDNGRKAYDRGERPLRLIPSADRGNWEPTITHHISVEIPSRFGPRFSKWSRDLVMFYRRK